jgi:hypothetical protein
MRKLLFNYSFYSHPEIGNFQGVTNLPPLKGISSRDSKMSSKRPGFIPNSFHILQQYSSFHITEKLSKPNLYYHP